MEPGNRKTLCEQVGNSVCFDRAIRYYRYEFHQNIWANAILECSVASELQKS